MSNTYDDYLVEQNWGSFTKEEHETWQLLFRRQYELLEGRACKEYVAGLEMLGITENNIPDFRRMNERLQAYTGWEVVSVEGLIPSRPFFDLLSDKKFPSGNFIRRRDQLDYLEEPDLFHDVFGHVPLLTNKAYADYMHAYGCAGDDAIEHKGVKYLARLNWYTIEFGLIREEDGPKIYGAGLVSSFGETKYALDDLSPNHMAFDLERVLRTGYYIDDFQASYFVIDSFEKLFQEAINTPFVPFYQDFKELPDLTPFEILEQDTVLQEGTKEYWLDFLQTKTKLK